MSIKKLIVKKVDDFIQDYSEFKEKEFNKKFLFFSLFYLLKDLKIEYEDIIDGMIDGSNDFGIDGIFVFAGGALLVEDDSLSNQINKDTRIKIKIIQTTTEDGFSETVLLKLRNGIEEIFDLDKILKGNISFIRKAKLIREVWEHCFTILNSSSIEIELIYVCLSNEDKINTKIKTLEERIYKYFNTQQLKYVKVRYIGIPELYKIISTKDYEKDLTFKDIASYAEQYNKKVLGYFGLVKLQDLLKFICNEDNELEEKYFEGNVRDYYGISKRVNEKIMDTVNSAERMNFWCLNNGITIICYRSEVFGKKLKLVNFNIVNGCQTAHVIYDCRETISNNAEGEILVKVIQTEDEATANNIIEATNSQTAVSPIALHSNDLIQKSIEEHFLKSSPGPFYYERRINYYKRRNKPSNKIVSMMKIFQTCYSIFEKKPSVARGRPTEAFEKDYDLVFSTSYDYDAYLFSYLLYSKVCAINRMEFKKVLTKQPFDPVLFVICNYGQLHIIRVIFSLMLKNDKKINLLDKKNKFTKEKIKLFVLLDKIPLLKLYEQSIIILRKSIVGYHKEKKVSINYNIFKVDEFDKKITQALNP